MLARMEILDLAFRGTAKWFSMVAAPLYIPTNTAQSSMLLLFHKQYIPLPAPKANADRAVWQGPLQMSVASPLVFASQVDS